MLNFKKLGLQALAVTLATGTLTSAVLASDNSNLLNNQLNTYINKDVVELAKSGNKLAIERNDKLVIIPKTGSNERVIVETKNDGVEFKAGLADELKALGTLSKGETFEALVDGDGYVKFLIDGKLVYSKVENFETITPSVVANLGSEEEKEKVKQIVAQAEAERKAAEEKARKEAEEKARKEAEEKARKEAEEKARKEAEEKARKEAEEKTRKEAEEKARKEAEEKARKEAERKARREAEEKAKKEAERKARREAEEKARREREAKEKKTTKKQSKSSNSSNRSSGSNGIVNTALKYNGYRYVSGGASPSGFDCSGFVQYVFKQNGISMPRIARDQYRRGVKSSYSNMKPGDLMFFGKSSSSIFHVGIYIGNGKYIHASTPKTGVKIAPVDSSWVRNNLYGVRTVR